MFSVTKVTLELQMSVHQSIIKIPQPLRIKPFCHYAYLLISHIPISHHAHQPPWVGGWVVVQVGGKLGGWVGRWVGGQCSKKGCRTGRIMGRRMDWQVGRRMGKRTDRRTGCRMERRTDRMMGRRTGAGRGVDSLSSMELYKSSTKSLPAGYPRI